MNTPPIPVPALAEMLPMPMMFLYGCLRQGQVNVDRENKVINISQMPYDPNQIAMYQQQVQQAQQQYQQQCAAAGIVPAYNDINLFNSIIGIYEEMKAFS
jgi:hypothetical protein